MSSIIGIICILNWKSIFFSILRLLSILSVYWQDYTNNSIRRILNKLANFIRKFVIPVFYSVFYIG